MKPTNIRDVDHTLYEEYSEDPDPERFQKHFIRWYESGGISKQTYSEKLQLLLCELREKYSWDEIAKRTSLASRSSLQQQASRTHLGEETSQNIYMNLKERLT